MHELSIAEALVRQAEAVMKKHGARRVTGITVAVGGLSGVDGQALEFAFPIACHDSSVRSATLAVERIRARVRCRLCGRESTPAAPFLACAECGSVEVDVIAGRELLIKSVELEVQDSDG